MSTEKRLIDANALLAELDKFVNPMPDTNGLHFLGGISTAITEIEDAPTVDAVPVVRCKDCKHCTATSDGMVCECALPTKRMQDYYIYGSSILARVEADAFCSHGERREAK